MTIETELRDVLRNLVAIVETAIDGGLFSLIDGNKPDIQELIAAKKILDTPQTNPVRFQISDEIGNLYYLYQTQKREWIMTNRQGTSMSFTYVCPDEPRLRFALQDAGNDRDRLLATVKAQLWSRRKVELV